MVILLFSSINVNFYIQYSLYFRSVEGSIIFRNYFSIINLIYIRIKIIFSFKYLFVFRHGDMILEQQYFLLKVILHESILVLVLLTTN
jgi:hypothetical protein